MTDVMRSAPLEEKPKVSPFYDPKVRSIVFQAALCLALVWLIWSGVANVRENLARAKIAAGFGFWGNTAGFPISQALIFYSEAGSTYGRAFWVGLLNTLLVASIGIVLATLLGFTVGIARLSKNFLISRIAYWYVEVIRNLPLLLQLLFWYNAVVKALPEVRDSIRFGLPYISLSQFEWFRLLYTLPVIGIGLVLFVFSPIVASYVKHRIVAVVGGSVLIVFGIILTFWGNNISTSIGGVYLNNRGVIMPSPVFGESFWLVNVTIIAGIIAALIFLNFGRRKQEKTGEQLPVGWAALGFVVGMPLIAFTVLGGPLTFEYPEAGRFNISGGVSVLPEFLALLFGLVIYTAAFIAEAVRAGILAVSKGQTEASYALGLRPKHTLNLVVVPQAMRVIIPPLTSHYLNLTKNSSLAVFVGYPDLVNIFTGTVLNQTGQAIEVVAITMLVYLTISLTTSVLMNWYNARKALVER